MASSTWRSRPAATYLSLPCRSSGHVVVVVCRKPILRGGTQMISTQVSRRNFAARFATFLSGFGIAGALGKAASAAPQKTEVQKLDYDGKPGGKGFMKPVIVHHRVVYI